MINKRAEFGLRAYFLGMLFFTAVMGIATLMIFDLAETYDNEGIINEQFEERYNHFQEFESRIESIRKLLTTSGGINIVNIGFGVFQATFSFIQLTLSSFGIIGEITTNFTEDFAVPYQIAGVVMAIFIGVIIITLIIRILNSLNPGRI